MRFIMALLITMSATAAMAQSPPAYPPLRDYSLSAPRSEVHIPIGYLDSRLGGPFIDQNWKPPSSPIRLISRQEVNAIFQLNESQWNQTVFEQVKRHDASAVHTSLGLGLRTFKPFGMVEIWPSYRNIGGPGRLYVDVRFNRSYTSGANLSIARQSVEATRHDLSDRYYVDGEATITDNGIIINLIISPRQNR